MSHLFFVIIANVLSFVIVAEVEAEFARLDGTKLENMEVIS